MVVWSTDKDHPDICIDHHHIIHHDYFGYLYLDVQHKGDRGTSCIFDSLNFEYYWEYIGKDIEV